MSEGNVGTIWYTVEADTAKLLGSVKPADASLDGLSKTFGRTDKAANAAEFQLTKTAAAVKGLGRESEGASSSLGGLGKVLGGLLTLQGVNAIIQMADGYNAMAERVRMATSSQEEYELVQQRLLATANGTYRAMSEAQEAYIQTADSIRAMGYSTEQALDITDSLSYAFVKNATSADRAQSTLRAYGLALNKGKVDANGWLTVMGAVPSLVADIAAAAGKSEEEIRRMGASGEVTARMFSEGLRKSADSNKAAAADMATTVADAFQSLRNNLAAFVGESNRASGATGVLSIAIVKVGENIDLIAKSLMAIGAGALAMYISKTAIATFGNVQAAMAAKALAAEELNLARAELTAANALVAKTNATNALVQRSAAATAALERQAAATTRLAAANAGAAKSGAGLLAVLGGPAGIIGLLATAAAGIAIFGYKSETASADVDKLTESIDKLNAAALRNRMRDASDLIADLEKTAESSAGMLKGLHKDYEALSAQLGRGVDAKGLDNVTRAIDKQQEALDEDVKKLNKAREALRLLEEESAKRDNSSLVAPAAQKDPEVEKRLATMRDELELAKLAGEARAKLQALQKLGANATAEERAEAERLAAEIYRLEAARKDGVKGTKDSAKAAEDNVKAIDKLAESLYLAGLEGEELAVAQARLTLNQYATPEQVAQLEALARAAYQASEAMDQRKKFGAGRKADEYIMGSVSPLSGGAFDEQYARYEAEAQAEQKRYAEQQERLATARELKIETQKSYDQLEQEAAQQHADRMAQIEEAKNSVILTSTSDALGAMADVLRQSKGEQSSIYKAMFAASKAFAIADAAVKIQGAIANAWNLPFPENLAAVGTVVAGTASIIGNIQSAGMGGGRQYGGPVGANKMYRINENGAPEILNTASGRQYLLPNSRGQVVSNKDATGGGQGQPAKITVIVNNAPAGTAVEQQRGADGSDVVMITVGDLRTGGRISQAMEATYGLTRRGS